MMFIIELKKYTRKYAKIADGNWLNDFDWQKVKLVIVSEFHNSGIMEGISDDSILIEKSNSEKMLN